MLEDDWARFWSKVDCSGGPDACWPWLADKDKDGYGLFKQGSKTRRASRIACGAAGSMFALHSCDNPPCCNPKHLFEGTALDNARDRDAKGRGAEQHGEHNGHAVLTAEKVLAIKRDYLPRCRTRSAVALAAKYGVRDVTVRSILKGRRWTDVTV